jgi:hypothetical protein
MSKWVLNPLWLRVRFAILVSMFEAIDRWENEGGATPFMYPPEPLLSERENTPEPTARHATSDRATPPDSAQTGPGPQHR